MHNGREASFWGKGGKREEGQKGWGKEEGGKEGGRRRTGGREGDKEEETLIISSGSYFRIMMTFLHKLCVRYPVDSFDVPTGEYAYVVPSHGYLGQAMAN